jgi:hypothetical protein
MQMRAMPALLMVCALVSLGGCVGPLGIVATSPVGNPGTDSSRERAAAAAREFIGQLRLGNGLDMDGKVPPALEASRFAAGDPIHLSMWEATDARAGSVIRVSVLDAADRVVWSAAKEAPPGGSYLSFSIGKKLAQGEYRADVIVDDRIRSRTGFKVYRWENR